MKFVNKVLDFLKGLLPGKSDKTNNEKDFSELLEGEGSKDSAFKTFALKSVKFIYKYLKKFVIFIIGLLFTIAQPMIKIAKKHPIAFWAAIILHAVLLYGLIYSNMDGWEVTQNKPSIHQPAPVEAIVIDIVSIFTINRNYGRPWSIRIINHSGWTFGQFNFHTLFNNWRCHHKDNQQHQHDIDIRNNIDIRISIWSCALW